MAHGHERGDYLTKFLNQLPQMYRAKQSIDLQRERLQYMKEEGFKDELYRAQVLTANQRRNQLALQEFKEKQQQNLLAKKQTEFNNEITTAANERADFTLVSTALAPYPELKKDWLKNLPSLKNDPEAHARIDATFKARTELDDRIYAAAALSPLERLEEYRKIRLDKNLNDTQIEYIDTGLTRAREEATVTLEEMQRQPAYSDVLAAQAEFKAISEGGRAVDIYGKYTETEDAFQTRRTRAIDRIFSSEERVREQERIGRGKYPGLSSLFDEKPLADEPMYGNIDDIPDTEVDEVLSDLGAPPIESNVLPPEFITPTPTTTTTTTPTPTPITVESEVPSAYTGQDEQQKQSVDFYYELLKDGKISTKRFYEAIQKEGVNVQSIDVGMMYKAKGKVAKKGLSVLDKTNIRNALNRIKAINKTRYTQEEKQKRIDKIKKRILAIDPNYKFKN